jgi:hypothetical protein
MTTTGSVPIDYHQFGVADFAVTRFPSAVGPMGLVSVAVGGAVIYTGIAAGFVSVSVDVRSEPPVVVDDPWEEIIEVSLDEAPIPVDPRASILGGIRGSDRRGFRIVGLLSGVEGFPVLNPAGGPCRLRVHARGRDRNWDGVDKEPREEYLLVAWPAPLSDEVIHKPLLGIFQAMQEL